MGKSDLIFLLLYARGKSRRDNEAVPTATHLQKEMFLLMRRSPFPEYKERYEFKPLWYGPFSRELSLDLNTLVNEGHVNRKGSISLTSNGFKIASRIWQITNNDGRMTAISIKEQFNRMTLDDILDYVYSHYPKQAMRSALNRNVVDDYFEDFWNTNDLSDEYFVNAVRTIRAK